MIGLAINGKVNDDWSHNQQVRVQKMRSQRPIVLPRLPTWWAIDAALFMWDDEYEHLEDTAAWE